MEPVIYFIGEELGVIHSTTIFSGVMIAVIPIVSIFAAIPFLHEKPTVGQVLFSFLSVGGVIGIEFACFYADLGCKVTVVEALDRLLPALDRELGQNLGQLLKKQGVRVLCGARVARIDKDGEGLRVRCEGKTGPEELAADLIDTGAVLTGGGAAMAELDRRIGQTLGIPCRVADAPETCAIRGLARILEDPDIWPGFEDEESPVAWR